MIHLRIRKALSMVGALLVAAGLSGCKGGEADSNDKHRVKSAPKTTDSDRDADRATEEKNLLPEPGDNSPDRKPKGPPPPEIPEPSALSVGQTVDERIASPEAVSSQGLKFETDWYVVDVDEKDKLVFTVEASDGGDLRPMITALLPDEDNNGKWKEIGARAAAEGASAVTLRLRFETGGEKLIAVDDARNIVGRSDDGDTQKSAYLGGETFDYQLRVLDPYAKKK